MTTQLLADNEFQPSSTAVREETAWDRENDAHRDEAPRPRRPAKSPGNWLILCTMTLVTLLGVVAVGAFAYTMFQPPPAAQETPPPQPVAEVKRQELAQNVFLEKQGDVRRVVVLTTVVHREGQLEGLLTKAKTKEHEYILAFDGDAINIHTALLAAGAEAGSPVKFEPRYVPASGTTIKMTVRYEKSGRMVSFPAQEWVQNVQTKKQLDQDWVFAGSRLHPDEENPQKKIYLANYGDLVCVCNMDTAMLDLPVRSPKTFDARLYQAFTERLPPKGTKVELILEPVKPARQ